MKPRLVVASIFLVTLGLALYWFGVFTPASTPPAAPPTVSPPVEPPGLTTPVAKEPAEEPEPQYPDFAAPTRVLLLGQENRSFSAWLLQLFEFGRRVKYQAWYAVPAGDSLTTHSDSLPALEAQPTLQDLDGVQVLIVCPLDPSRFSSEFWTSVADRVRAGSLGLMLVPDYAYGQAMAEIPALQSVSPIAKARAVAPIVAGGPIAGVYPNPHPILLAADAVEHPAARIVPFKRWNASWWDSLGRGDAKAAWTTKFCSPIESLVPGSVVLARLSAGMDTAPALVATSGEARVLWVGGFFDLETLAYKDSRSVLAFRTLLHAWMFWLAPPKS